VYHTSGTTHSSRRLSSTKKLTILSPTSHTFVQDINKNNVINYTEFLAAALQTQGIIEEYRLAEAFDVLDCDDSGYSKYDSTRRDACLGRGFTLSQPLYFSVSKENLRHILGEQVDEIYIDHLIAEADFLKDGQISYGEFLHAFQRQKSALVDSIYEKKDRAEDSDRSLTTDAAADEVLRRFGIIKGLKKAFNSNVITKANGRLARNKSR
jgi:Ca2+-binding EF-hand superfamily protein